MHDINNESEGPSSAVENSGFGEMLIGRKVIVRTYSAGVHYGKLIEKENGEVILEDSRRLYRWKTNNSGISLSEVANTGLDGASKVCSPVPILWLNAIEIIPCSNASINSIESQDEHKA